MSYGETGVWEIALRAYPDAAALPGAWRVRSTPLERRLRCVNGSTSRAGRVRVVPDAAVEAAAAARLGGTSAVPPSLQDREELARAVALLGDGAQLRHAAALARLSLDAAARAADELAHRRILVSGTPLRFVEGSVRTAVYRDIPVVLRSVRHAEAAAILADEGVDPDVVCTHLLEAEPVGSLDVVALLRDAARRARDRGSVELAISYLERALKETADVKTRRHVLHDLGQSTRVSRTARADEQLQAALSLTDDPDERRAIATDLAEVRFLAGARDAALRVAPDARLGNALTVALDAYDARRVHAFDQDLGRLIADAGQQGHEALGAALAGVLAWRGEPEAAVRPLLMRGLRALERGSWDESQALPIQQSLLALSLLDDTAAAWALIDQLRQTARTTSSVSAEALAAAHAAVLNARTGKLADAESDLLAVVELGRERAVALVAPMALCLAADAVVERPALHALVTTVDAVHDDETVEGAMLHELRGRLALAHGRTAGARDHLEAAAATYEALRLCSARASSWRCFLALALADSDGTRASRLASTELERAQSSGSPRAIGVALRTVASIGPGSRAISALKEAVAVLEPSDARLEYARALVDLGAALRRANHRTAARAPLRAGLESAELSGALRLRERALVELQATGARPRRAMLSGPESLTAAERRVADLAVQGLGNPEIAQTLYVTINTVEGHLRHVYQKLSINSRRQLPNALREQAV